MTAVLVMAACGGDGGGGLTAAEAQPRIDAAVLTLEDLGEGWEVADSEEEDDPLADEELEECLGEDAARILGEDGEHDLGDDVEVGFARENGGAFQSLQVMSGGVDDETIFGQVIDVLSDSETAVCILDAIAAATQEVTGDEFTMTFGDWESDEGFIDDADQSVIAGAEITLSAEEAGMSFDGRLDLVVVTTDQIGSLMVAASVGDVITNVQLEEWGELLAERQAG